ncbi:uncharacterized protein SPPG_08000 [Spizellomyces punctatus DAOM BR117]|uniref:Axonemal dynein light chain domain-containing protein 1 n=1 Tax=Spizellomyces punctatus (strain DAOM BR117) TaxID=645134 RepID=A0A0L0H7C3_SPIPD|nr:uncharacterized protein SPPG_08000 [Spizellomyces punctatus DAOM BR117]KNC96796.1 hypothetical protein SPPG_08000 [Spizellomyces punctatus DAOM BR117]|eukprot:XP_016604836.1 hypothetical protein SPPG_08000 [Spizellomyces punctatus DAOM BR117]
MSYLPTALLSDLSRLSTQGPKPTPARKTSTRAKAFTSSKADPLPEAIASNTGLDAPSTQSTPTAHVQKGAYTASPASRSTIQRTPASRVAQISRQAPGINDDLSFIYDAGHERNFHAEQSEDVSRDTGGQRGRTQSFPGDRAGSVTADSMNIVAPGVGANGSSNVPASSEHQLNLAAMRPTTRKEVALLKHTMEALIKEIGAEMDQEYPTEMHAFLAIIQEEQKIYDAVFQELIRQVTVNMIERGEVLAEIRNRYANMFTKIPKHVKHLHTELLAQRKLNRRLSHELLRSKETVADLVRELEIIRKHDLDVTKQAQDAQEKLVSVLTQSDNTGEILEEYHKLYRMQRDRLEDAVRLAEQEKRIWVDAATALALRIGQEHGIADIVLLQKYEHARLRATNHMTVIISNTNDSQLHNIERKIEEWRSKLIRLSQSVVEEDQHNIETLAKMQRDMDMVLRNLDTGDQVDTLEVEHPLLKAFQIHDVKSLSEHLMKWVEQITSVAIRFTSDRDLAFQEDISQIRKETEVWIEGGYKLLRRNEKNTNGKDYLPLTEILSRVGLEVQEWLTKLEMRVSGEDGIASNVINLQNQLEDRYTTYSARDLDKPLPFSERQSLRDSLTNWSAQIGKNLIDTLSNTTEKEQHKIPLHVENWLSRLLDQLNTDTDIRNEENIKLHTTMISWMVHLLVRAGREKPTDAWDHEFAQLTQELASFNANLMRDAAEIQTLSEDGRDLREIVQTHCEHWVTVAKRLLANEKKNATTLHNAPKRPLSLRIDELDDNLELPPTQTIR